MLDLWARDTWIAVLITVSAVLTFFVQLILCFRAKKLPVRLLPVALSASAATVSHILIFAVKDWSALIYAVCAVSFQVLLISAGIAWGIWAIIAARNTGKPSGSPAENNP